MAVKKETLSTGETITTTTTPGWVTYDAKDYSKELAVLKSDMDDITKIKIIQALKEPSYGNIYWQQSKEKIDTSPKVSWTGTNPVKPITIGDGFIHLVDYASQPIYSVDTKYSYNV